MKKELSLLLLMLLFFIPPLAYSAAPSDTVKGNLNKALEVLGDPALKGERGKQLKTEKIRSIAEEVFDFTELSKRSLGQNWNKLNADQQEEFIRIFKSLLETAYVDKMMSYKDEKVLFKDEISLSERTAEVRTTILRNGSETPIHYRLIEKNGSWKVYDVVIEGISLVNNYRTQFRDILANKTCEALLDILRKKVADAHAS